MQSLPHLLQTTLRHFLLRALNTSNFLIRHSGWAAKKIEFPQFILHQFLSSYSAGQSVFLVSSPSYFTPENPHLQSSQTAENVPSPEYLQTVYEIILHVWDLSVKS
ncbi:hypothetical protein ATANTOWER_003996 [Ataeniobius toweri]|uniref:Uncharacterized protein n=1 Tax=Ataeniobius toweri TaxID=208326 RepID=A0ABU7AWZ1_9TELE|nr:hypothetical protein [Ataeniobius toweri]